MNMINKAPVAADAGQVIVTRSALLPALQAVSAVASARSTIPIIGNVLLRAEADGLTLVGCNMDIEIAERVEAAAGAAWACTVSAARLLALARSLRPGAEIALRLLGEDASQRLEIVSGGLRVLLFTLPVEDFPRIVTGEFPPEWAIEARVLRGLFARTLYAVSRKETRYYLKGVCLEARDCDLVATATDGYRLASVTAPVDAALQLAPAIIPHEVVRRVQAALGRNWPGEGVIVEIAPKENRARFRIGAQTILAKLIDGTYPDWRKVIPAEHRLCITLEKRALLDALNQVGAVTPAFPQPIEMCLGEHGLSVHAKDRGEAEAECLVPGVAGATTFLSVGFNLRYLRQALGQIGGDVELHLTDGAAPAVLRDTADRRFMCVLMPMRI